MPLDHSKATVTIEVVGLALSCINKRERNRCEIGILRCDRHTPVLDIQRIEFDPRTRIPVRSSLVPHALNLNENILIDVVYPNADGGFRCGTGTSTYRRREFDRQDDTGDDEDFRWVPDLEGPEFHGRKLRITHKSKLQPKIFLTDGILYARQKTDETFARVSLKGRPSQAALGRLAYGIGADLTCENGGAVVLKNLSRRGSPEGSSRCSVTLPKEDCVRYLVTIENHCQLADDSEGTDFRLYYEVLRDPDGREFDLRRTVETGGHAAPEEALSGREDLSLDGYPQNCAAVYLGQTDTLGSPPDTAGSTP